LFVCLFAGPSSGMDRPDEPWMAGVA
jgi:hypothetical protein